MSLLDGLKSLSRPRLRRDRSFWLDDNRVVSCYECDAPFTLLNRKHRKNPRLRSTLTITQILSYLLFADCRACGRIFCSNCTTSCVLEDGQSAERVCNFCTFHAVHNLQISLLHWVRPWCDTQVKGCMWKVLMWPGLSLAVGSKIAHTRCLHRQGELA